MANTHRASQSRSRTRRRNSRSFTWLWMLFGIFIGVGGTAFSYIVFTNASLNLPSQTKAPVHKVPKKNKDIAQRFEFYTLLPGMEIQLPDPNPSALPKPVPPTLSQPVQVLVQPQASPKPSPVRPPVVSKVVSKLNPQIPAVRTLHKPTAVHYIIQAGIFQDLKNADALKVRLTRQGLNTRIQKVQTQAGQTWFRVTLGPFASESLALNQKKRLEAQKIHGILILQRPPS